MKNSEPDLCDVQSPYGHPGGTHSGDHDPNGWP